MLAGDVPNDVFGVTADTADRRGAQRVQERKPDNVQPRLAPDNPPIVDGIAVRPEHGQVDPAEIGDKPGAPDDVRHVDDAPILESGPAVSSASCPRHAPNSGGLEVLVS